MRTTRIGLTLLTTTAAIAVLAACSGSPGASSSTTGTGASPAASATSVATEKSTATGTDGSSATPSASSTCGTLSASSAVQQAVATLSRPVPDLADATWDAGAADTSGYDPCAALSWAVVSVTGGTPSSPNAILLFHDGAYLGTATKEQYPFQPQIARRTDASIAVTYRWAKPEDANADPTGRTDATFTWDAAHDEVAMNGAVPPSS